MKVNLFIAGACKSGTSFLHDFLGKQNEICASIPKEPYYFELPRDNRNEETYFQKYFRGYNGEKYVVDGRHRNMFFNWIPQEIYDYNTESKIIFILRNPIERAYSHWWMWYSRNIIKRKFHNTITMEIKRISEKGFQMDMSPEEYQNFVRNEAPMGRLAYADANTIVESGYYYSQILRYKKLFKENQLLILDYEEISNLGLLSRKLQDFLKVEVRPIEKQLINKAPDFVKQRYPLMKYVPKKIKTIFKNHFFKKGNMTKTSRALLKDQYSEEISKLEKELGVEFANEWN